MNIIKKIGLTLAFICTLAPKLSATPDIVSVDNVTHALNRSNFTGSVATFGNLFVNSNRVLTIGDSTGGFVTNGGSANFSYLTVNGNVVLTNVNSSVTSGLASITFTTNLVTTSTNNLWINTTNLNSITSNSLHSQILSQGTNTTLGFLNTTNWVNGLISATQTNLNNEIIRATNAELVISNVLNSSINNQIANLASNTSLNFQSTTNWTISAISNGNVLSSISAYQLISTDQTAIATINSNNLNLIVTNSIAAFPDSNSILVVTGNLYGFDSNMNPSILPSGSIFTNNWPWAPSDESQFSCSTAPGWIICFQKINGGFCSIFDGNGEYAQHYYNYQPVSMPVLVIGAPHSFQPISLTGAVFITQSTLRPNGSFIEQTEQDVLSKIYTTVIAMPQVINGYAGPIITLTNTDVGADAIGTAGVVAASIPIQIGSALNGFIATNAVYSSNALAAGILTNINNTAWLNVNNIGYGTGVLNQVYFSSNYFIVTSSTGSASRKPAANSTFNLVTNGIYTNTSCGWSLVVNGSSGTMHDTNGHSAVNSTIGPATTNIYSYSTSWHITLVNNSFYSTNAIPLATIQDTANIQTLMSTNFQSTTNYINKLVSTNIPTLEAVVKSGGIVVSNSVTIDALNLRTNTFGGILTILGYSVQEGSNNVSSGINSHTEGENNIAIGESSHAEGYGTISSNYPSHAEGEYSLASGEASHAEGGNTIASLFGAHAEGYGTIASNYESHAEGYSTIAAGYHSHAEGAYTVALGEDSHAEGAYTTASGNKTHAEGESTIAAYFTSHAEGYGTIASNVSAHAEGYDTTASGEESHAEGLNSIASGNTSHAAGYNSRATNDYSYVWSSYIFTSFYTSLGTGTYCINPSGGINGFYIGTSSLSSILTNATAPANSNATNAQSLANIAMTNYQGQLNSYSNALNSSMTNQVISSTNALWIAVTNLNAANISINNIVLDATRGNSNLYIIATNAQSLANIALTSWNNTVTTDFNTSTALTWSVSNTLQNSINNNYINSTSLTWSVSNTLNGLILIANTNYLGQLNSYSNALNNSITNNYTVLTNSIMTTSNGLQNSINNNYNTSTALTWSVSNTLNGLILIANTNYLGQLNSYSNALNNSITNNYTVLTNQIQITSNSINNSLSGYYTTGNTNYYVTTNQIISSWFIPSNAVYSSSITINPQTGNLQSLTLTGATTINIAPTNTSQFGLFVLNLNAGTNSVTWSAAISNQTALPTLYTNGYCNAIYFIQPVNVPYWSVLGGK